MIEYIARVSLDEAPSFLTHLELTGNGDETQIAVIKNDGSPYALVTLNNGDLRKMLTVAGVIK